MMSNALRAKRLPMNAGSLETLYIGRPGGHYQIWVYNETVGTTDPNNALEIPAGGEIIDAVELNITQDAESFVRSVQQVEDDDAF